MSATQLLEQYISKHPDFWEYENELKEVMRLKELCRVEALLHTIVPVQSSFRQQVCA